MSYKKGKIKVDNEYGPMGCEDKVCIYLPHSCDEWIIGGVEEAELMIEDLQEAIKKFSCN